MLLKDIHTELRTWATHNKLTFSPEKYHLMHFEEHKNGPKSRKPERDKDCASFLKELGLKDLTAEKRKELMPESLKILGVVFDKGLTWQSHVEEVRLCFR